MNSLEAFNRLTEKFKEPYKTQLRNGYDHEIYLNENTPSFKIVNLFAYWHKTEEGRNYWKRIYDALFSNPNDPVYITQSEENSLNYMLL